MPFLNEEGKQYHINCKEGDVVVMCCFLEIHSVQM